jgi:hypothetical protein
VVLIPPLGSKKGEKLVKKLSGTLKDSASSAENNFQSYNDKILPTEK